LVFVSLYHASLIVVRETFCLVFCLLVATAPAHAQSAGHWSYETLRRPAVPYSPNVPWLKNTLDAFTSARMRSHDLIPSREADPATLIRRVTLGLTGLPPTLDEIDAFLADTEPGAYERLVERLLASPRYGERMATPWLDLARYADSHGYHMDAHREMSAWRDWVIDALNANMPFDQFTVEQIAGDLLPDASRSQLVASGFNRNNMVNFENGALAAEYLTEYAVDRTVTTSTVWMGQTMQCARCHDHKYDPFTQREFYQLLAFFNQVPEQGIDGDQGNAAPFVRAPTPEQQRQREQLANRIAAYDRQLRQREATCGADQIAWEASRIANRTESRPPEDMVLHVPLDQVDPSDHVDEGTTPELVRAAGFPVTGPAFLPTTKFGRGLLFGGDTFVECRWNVEPAATDSDPLDFSADQPFSVASWIFPTTGGRMTLVAKQGDAPMLRGYEVSLEDSHIVVSIVSDHSTSRLQVRTVDPTELRDWQHVVVSYDGSGVASGLHVYVDGVSQQTSVDHDDLRGSITTSQPLRIGRGATGTPFRGVLDEVRIYAHSLTPTEAELLAGGDPVGDILAVARDQRSSRDREALRAYYLRHHDPTFRELGSQRDRALRMLSALDTAIPTSMVMRDADSPRPTFVLSNGQYDTPSDRVSAGTPATFFPLPADAPRNRLGLARWLVDPRHPLTARVAVNRIWQTHFGAGLVTTPEDFGTRGERPSHPQLLDWLAAEFVHSGWDTKHVDRLIVTSATYRQSSDATPAAWSRDPTNRWLARGPRRRLSAEMIRDQALAASGLLYEQLGGPSVFPYQPPGLWKEVSYEPNEFTAQVYQQDHGAKLYRRSLYTFWKRSVPAPALATLGAPNREICVARRSPANTPLEALVLMNETAFVEAARQLAERVISSSGTSDEIRLRTAFRMTTGRSPQPAELATLLNVLSSQRSIFHADVDGARQLLAVGESPMRSKSDPRELAAWTMLTNMMFCLDETITVH